MEISSGKNETVFRKDYNGKTSYSLGLSKKNKDGQYENGYIKANFRKGTNIENMTKIKINKAWLDFYKDNEKTIPTIFVDDFEVIKEKEDKLKPYEEFSTRFEAGKQMEISDDDFPW